MSDKLTDLTNLPIVDLADKIYVVDTDDPTDDPAGSSKEADVSALPFADEVHMHVKSDIANFEVVAADISSEASTDGQILTSDGAGNAAWEDAPSGGGGVEEAPVDGTPYARQDAGWVPASAGGSVVADVATKVEIGRVSGTDVAALDIVIDSTGYERIEVAIVARSHEASVTSVGRMYFNEDYTDGNYAFTLCGANATDAFEDDGPLPVVGYLAGAQSDANAKTIYSIVIPPTGGLQTAQVQFSAPNPSNLVNHYTGTVSMSHRTATDAIDHLRFKSDVGNVTGEMIVYGVKTQDIGGGSGGTGGGETITSKSLIAEIENTTAGFFDFSGIDTTGYTRLYVEGYVSGSKAASLFENMRVEINGDSANGNYWRQAGYAGNGSATWGQTESAHPYVATIPSASSDAGTRSYVECVIQDPADATLRNAIHTKAHSIFTNGAYSATGTSSVIHDSDTAAITQLKFTGEAGDAGLTGKLRLYGEKEVTTGGGGTGGGGGTVNAVVGTVLGEIKDTTASSFDFDNLDLTGYDRVEIECQLRNVAAADGYAEIELNGVTTGSVSTVHYSAGGSGGAVQYNGSGRVAWAVSSALPATDYGHSITTILEPGGTKKKDAEFRVWTPNALIVNGTAETTVTDPITRINIVGESAETFLGSVRIVGYKETAIGGGGGGGAAEGVTLIETIELGTEGEFDFTAIPQIYSRLILKGYFDSPTGAAVPYAYAYLNENTTATDYRCGLHQVYNGSNSVAELNDPSIVYLGGSAAQTVSSMEMVLENYTSSAKKFYRVTSGSEYGAGNVVSMQASVAANELNPVTRLRITNPTANGLTGRLQLYGEV